MKFKYSIKGIDCPNCASKLSGMMAKLEGVESAKINFLTEKLTVESDTEESVLLPALKRCAKAFSSDIEIC